MRQHAYRRGRRGILSNPVNLDLAARREEARRLQRCIAHHLRAADVLVLADAEILAQPLKLRIAVVR